MSESKFMHIFFFQPSENESLTLERSSPKATLCTPAGHHLEGTLWLGPHQATRCRIIAARRTSLNSIIVRHTPRGQDHHHQFAFLPANIHPPRPSIGGQANAKEQGTHSRISARSQQTVRPTDDHAKTCQAPYSLKPAPVAHIRVAYELWSNRYTE
jgi:hypothetical protein